MKFTKIMFTIAVETKTPTVSPNTPPIPPKPESN